MGGESRGNLVYLFPHGFSPKKDLEHKLLRERLLLEELRKAGFSTRIVTFDFKQKKAKLSLKFDGLEVVSYQPHLLTRRNKKRAVSLRLLADLRRWKPRVVLFKGSNYRINYLLNFLRVAPVRVLVSSGRKWNRHEGYTHYLYEDEGHRRTYQLTESGVAEKYFKYCRQADTITTRAAAGQPEKAYDFTAVGALSPLKNLRPLLALAGQGYSVCVIGDGPLRDVVSEEADRLPNLTWIPAATPERVYETLAMSRFLVHMSISEGFPRVIAEALSVGTPVIYNRDTIHYEDLVGHQLGMPTSVADLPQTAARALADYADEPFRQRCLSYAATHFNAERVTHAAQSIVRFSTSSR